MLMLTSFLHVVVILHRPITSRTSLLLLLPLLSAAVASAAMVGGPSASAIGIGRPVDIVSLAAS